jgi:hypothetical protein
VEDDEETHAKGDDERHKPEKKFEEVEADLAEHGDIGGEARVAAGEQETLAPGQQDDEAVDVARHNSVLIMSSKEHCEGEANKDQLQQVLNIEQVPGTMLE